MKGDEDSSLASMSDRSQEPAAEDSDMKQPVNIEASLEQMQALYYMDEGDIMRVQYSESMEVLGQKSHLDY